MALALSVGFAAGALLMGGDQEISQTVLVNNTVITEILQEKIKNDLTVSDVVINIDNVSANVLKNVDIKGDYKVGQTINLTATQTQQIKDVDIGEFSASVANEITNEAIQSASQTSAGFNFTDQEMISEIEANTEVITRETQRLVTNTINALNSAIEASNESYENIEGGSIGGSFIIDQTIDVDAIISQQVDNYTSTGFEASASTMISNIFEQESTQIAFGIGMFILFILIIIGIVMLVKHFKNKKAKKDDSSSTGFGIFNFGRRKR